jgi:N-acetylglucosaminyl-diphospho-decaprenol L-rhamnosyltransferase
MFEEKIQFVIVNYRTPQLTIRCVNSMVAVGIRIDDIVIVDNCSQDGSAETISSAISNARIIQSEHNGGFSAGVNIGVRSTNSKYVLVLNPDTLFVSNFIDHVIAIFKCDPSIGIVGLNLLNPDLSPQYSARRFYSLLDVAIRRGGLGTVWPWRLLNDRHLMKKELSAGRVFDADWVMGTGFIVRRDVFDRLQGMDEGYFLYMDDVDLCARVWDINHRVVCVPAASIIHDHQRASAKGVFSKAARYHQVSLRRFSSKFRVPVFYARSREQILRNRSVRYSSAMAEVNDGTAILTDNQRF